MDCMCSTANENLQKLPSGMDIDILKKIAFVLPDLVIPVTVYACATCLDDVTTFYEMKITSLGNYCYLNRYKDILEGINDVKFKELKVVIASHEISTKRERDAESKINANYKDLLSSKDEDQLINKNSNLSDREESKQSLYKKRQFNCNKCDKAFTCRSQLEMHSRVHTGEKPYKCTTCQKTFTQCSALTRHKVIHSGEKSHECDVCHKTFNRTDVLISHKLCHSNERPYECTVCSKGFTQSSHLTVHMLTHTGKKPHLCHVCEYKSTRAGDLKRHMRTHTDEKPYICNFCKKSFTHSSTVKEHKQRLHNNEDLN